MLALVAPVAIDGVMRLGDGDDGAAGDGLFPPEFTSSLCYYIFDNPWAFAYAVLTLAFVALLIYLMDKRILRKTGGLTPEQARKTALHMAVFTAPYLYFVPERDFEGFLTWLAGLF